jgi:hypothetical protein
VTEKGRERESVCECVCVSAREKECVSARERVCVYAYQRQFATIHIPTFTMTPIDRHHDHTMRPRGLCVQRSRSHYPLAVKPRQQCIDIGEGGPGGFFEDVRGGHEFREHPSAWDTSNEKYIHDEDGLQKPLFSLSHWNRTSESRDITDLRKKMRKTRTRASAWPQAHWWSCGDRCQCDGFSKTRTLIFQPKISTCCGKVCLTLRPQVGVSCCYYCHYCCYYHSHY